MSPPHASRAVEKQKTPHLLVECFLIANRGRDA